MTYHRRHVGVLLRDFLLTSLAKAVTNMAATPLSFESLGTGCINAPYYYYIAIIKARMCILVT